MRRLRLVLFVFLLTSCGKATPTKPVDSLADGWRTQTDGGMSPEQVRKTTLANNARDALAKALTTELTTAIAQHGARGAIVVCKERAPALTAAVAEQHQVRIGRIGVRARNDANQAPAWATARKWPHGPSLAAGPNGALGMLMPILMQPLCVQCHGAPEQLGEGVAAALREHYPNDRATGFAVGELRGWFWVEVP